MSRSSVEIVLCPTCTAAFDKMAETAETVGDEAGVLPLSAYQSLCARCLAAFQVLLEGPDPGPALP